MALFPGFNTNIRHKNKIFHIQTEVISAGDKNSISTLVYLEGRIFHSVKGVLPPAEAIHRETAALVIVKQHKEAIKKLISNQLSAADSAALPRGTINIVEFTELYQEKKFFSVFDLKAVSLRGLVADLMTEPQ